ncbi:MAG: HD domain-containing protein [Actinomycetota bacterium]|nr:HD domain-containing protein [Actinomycetota bacterium]
MARARLYRISMLVFVSLTLVAGLLGWLMRDNPRPVVIGSLLMGATLMLNVPALSGQRVYLGIGAAAAIPLAVSSAGLASAIYAISLALAWIGYLLFRPIDRNTLNSEYLAEVVAIAGFGGMYHVVSILLGVSWMDFETAWPNEGLVAIVGAVVGGVVYLALRAVTRSLIGLERADLSVRYLWLAGLEDWSAITVLIVAGTVVGTAYSVLGWTAILVAAVPYSFTHTALARYQGTKITYNQTIQAISQIPEVAGLAPRGHAVRTGHLARDIGREMGLHPDEVEHLEFAGYMHDIGRITLNEPAILRAGFTDLDIARWGSQIIAEAPHLGEVASIVGDQCLPYRSPGQERDPEVSTTSKIVKVVSAYDQAVHEMKLPAIDALEQLHRGSAYEFDPQVTSSLRRVLVFRGEIPASD